MEGLSQLPIDLQAEICQRLDNISLSKMALTSREFAIRCREELMERAREYSKKLQEGHVLQFKGPEGGVWELSDNGVNWILWADDDSIPFGGSDYIDLVKEIQYRSRYNRPTEELEEELDSIVKPVVKDFWEKLGLGGYSHGYNEFKYSIQPWVVLPRNDKIMLKLLLNPNLILIS